MQVQVSLTIEIGATASFTQMEEQIQEAGQQAMREALKQTIKQWEDQRPVCPHCGQKQRRLEGTVRRSIATTFGRVAVPRRRFRCQECGRRWCPATSLFSELKGGTISQPLQEAAMLAGCSWPYRAASSLLRRLSGAQISAEEIRHFCQKSWAEADLSLKQSRFFGRAPQCGSNLSAFREILSQEKSCCEMRNRKGNFYDWRAFEDHRPRLA
jgi:transposase-like protein